MAMMSSLTYAHLWTLPATGHATLSALVRERERERTTQRKREYPAFPFGQVCGHVRLVSGNNVADYQTPCSRKIDTYIGRRAVVTPVPKSTDCEADRAL